MAEPRLARHEVAALEQEREFLLRSLRDLEAERDAGDLDGEDYRALRDDYTARAARVLRALQARAGESQPAGAVGERYRWSPLRLAVVAVLVVAVTGGAVMAVIVSSGQRGPTQAVSGVVPPGGEPRLQQAQRMIARKDYLGAVKLYDRILADRPTQPEALTYRGWLLRLTGLQGPNLAALADEGLKSIERAEQSDPNYPDAHVFRGIILYQDRHDPAGAVAEFRTFLSLDPANPLAPTVEGLLQRALAGEAPSPAPNGPATSAP